MVSGIIRELQAGSTMQQPQQQQQQHSSSSTSDLNCRATAATLTSPFSMQP